MQSDFEMMLHEAEVRYLQDPDVLLFKRHYISLQERLEAYRSIRDQELSIFQPIADPLLEAFPSAQAQDVERALRHWIAVLRYAAMAMLMNNPEFLRRRILEWLTDVVQAHQLQAIELKLYDLMVVQIKAAVPKSQIDYLMPFLEQAKLALLSGNKPEVMMASRN
jgi:hypothetical protein